MSLCAHAILGTDVLQVEDTLADPRFADNPLVSGGPRLRFYAGMPLMLDDGSRVGTLCVADHRPRHLDDEQLDALRRTAALVVQELQAG
jgi:GAF domain-containing protein